MASTPRSPHLWQAADDLDAQDVNYLRELVTSQASMLGLVGALGLGALISIPLGLGVGAIPIITALAAESIAALFVPSSPVFREFVDRRKRQERREAVRDHLITELRARTNDGDTHWTIYQRMRDRLTSVHEIQRRAGTTLTYRNVEDLDDVTVDYLGLWLAWMAMRERYDAVDEKGMSKRIAQIQVQREQSEDAVDRHHMDKAVSDLEGILERRKSLWARGAAVEAGMLSMADTFEEVYQRLLANPTSAEAATALTAAVDRMRVEEELEFEVDSELEELMQRRKGRLARAGP